MRRVLTVSGVLTVVLGALAWVFIAPGGLGGRTTYVVTHGISMEPRFHTGDLAVLFPQSQYRVGEIAAYHSQTLHTVVMHRIVGRDGDAFVFKGDNNSWLDPDHPTQADMLGRLVLQIPKGGRYLAALHSPTARLIAGGVLALLFFAGATSARRRRALRTSGGGRHRAGRHRAPRQSRRRPRTAPRPAASPMTPDVVSRRKPATPARRGQLVGAACLVVALVSAEAWLWQLPTTTQVARSVTIPQHGTFSYTASVPTSMVYPQGRVHPGDPVFTKIVHSLRVSFAYEADAPTAGGVSLSAVLVGPSGWRHPLASSPVEAISAGKGTASVGIDLAAVQAALTDFESATGVRSSGASLVVQPTVDVHGWVGGQPVSGQFTGNISFAINADDLTLVTSGAGTADPLKASSALTATVPALGPRVLSGLGRQVGVRLARIVVGAAGGIAIAMLIAALVGWRREGRAEDDVETALRQYGERIVDADSIPLEGPVVDLTSLAALHSVAERYDRVILHSARSDRHSYVVRDELSWYRYEIRPDRGQHAARRGTHQTDVVLPEAGVISLEPRLRPGDILPGAAGTSAWADGYGRAS